MTLRAKRTARVAEGEHPDPHRRSRGSSVFFDRNGPPIWRLVSIAVRIRPDVSAGQGPCMAAGDGPLRVTPRTKGEKGEVQV